MSNGLVRYCPWCHAEDTADHWCEQRLVFFDDEEAEESWS